MSLELAVYPPSESIPDKVFTPFLEDNKAIELQHAKALAQELQHVCFYWDLLDPSWKTPEGLQRFRRRKSRIDALAYIDGRYAGYVSYHLGCNQIHTWLGLVPPLPKTIHVDEIYVRPEYRRQGIATALLQHVTEVGKQNRCSQLTLASMVSNREAYALYRSKAFRVVEKQLYGVPSRRSKKACAAMYFDPSSQGSEHTFWPLLRKTLNQDAAVFYPLGAVMSDIEATLQRAFFQRTYSVIQFQSSRKLLAYGIRPAGVQQSTISAYTNLLIPREIRLDAELFSRMASQTFTILEAQTSARMMNVNSMTDTFEAKWLANGFKVVYELLAKTI